MLRDLVQPVGKMALAAPPLYLFKTILQCLRNGLSFCFSGQSSQIGSQFFGFAVSNAQRHISLHVEVLLCCNITLEDLRKPTFLQNLLSSAR
jgi:hypothetical protein